MAGARSSPTSRPPCWGTWATCCSYVAADKNDQKFQHRYYVDGPVTVSDVNVGGVWKTIAVGTTGAGGRSVFALDITNPDSVQVLWEVNNLITGNAAITGNIGNVLGKPVIVPVKSTASTRSAGR